MKNEKKFDLMNSTSWKNEFPSHEIRPPDPESPKHCHHFLFRLLSTYFNWIYLTLKSVKHLLKVFYVTKKLVVAYIKSPKPSLFRKHLFVKCIYFIYQNICPFLLIFKQFWFPISVRVKPVFRIVCQQNVHAQDFLREPATASGCWGRCCCHRSCSCCCFCCCSRYRFCCCYRFCCRYWFCCCCSFR